MVEFAAVQDYEQAEGVTIPRLVLTQGNPSVTLPSAQNLPLFDTEPPNVWICRYAVVSGTAGGTTDGSVVSLAMLTGEPAVNPWPSGGVAIIPSAMTLIHGRDHWYAWGTDLSQSSTGVETDFDRISNTPIPAVWLGPSVRIQVTVQAVPPSDNTFTINHAWIQMERYAPNSLSGAVGEQPSADIYLLQGGG